MVATLKSHIYIMATTHFSIPWSLHLTHFLILLFYFCCVDYNFSLAALTSKFPSYGMNKDTYCISVMITDCEQLISICPQELQDFSELIKTKEKKNKGQEQLEICIIIGFI